MPTTIHPPAYVMQSENQSDKGYDPKIARRLTNEFIRPYRWMLVVALFFMLTASAASVAGPYYVKIALDSGLVAQNDYILRMTIFWYLVTACVQWGMSYGRVYTMNRLGQYILFDVRTHMFEHLQRLSLSFYSRFSVGRVITRVINDVGVLREFITWDLLAIARNIFTLVGVIVAMLSMNLRLSLLTFTVLPVMVVATIIFRRAASRVYRKVRSAISWVNSVLAENINGVRVVQAFSRQAYNYDQFHNTVTRYHLDMAMDTARVSSVFPPVVDLLGAIATALVVWIGGAAVLGESITAGILVAFVLYIDRFFDPIRDLSRRFDSLQSALIAGERIFALLDTPVEVQDAPDASELPVIKGNVTFNNVSFHYSDDPTPVLDNIELSIHAGETVALVGETGAGKTTMIKLLARFNDPTDGCVLVDDHDLRTVTQQSLRQQMGIVLQDPFLFNGTVAENIRFGRLEATNDEIEKAARAVGAHEFIVNLRKGYDTSVEEGGVMLSVGQRQLLSFARALLADPRILILDEATSSVDTQTEQVIQKALAHLLKGRTSFVIAHRLSTITNADLIVVIQDGKIVERGTHIELLEKQDLYYDLYRTGFQD